MKHEFYGDVFIKTLEGGTLLDKNNQPFMELKHFTDNINFLSNIYIYVSFGGVYYSTTDPNNNNKDDDDVIHYIRLLDF